MKLPLPLIRRNAILVFLVANTIVESLYAQQKDTSKVVKLHEVVLNENHISGTKHQMPDVKENIIYTGKKTEVILVNKLNADLSINNARQIFAKVPGISIWENDGSGIQTSISSRGLSPNRSWEFNVKQNGYDISSEAFGYPESYYTPPSEALGRIEIIRGASSLQFGPQFGGLLNYEIKKGSPLKPICFETQQTIGSYGLFNSYNALGGTIGKFNYYGFLHHRNADGWRMNSRYQTYTAYFSANYQLNKKTNIAAEYTNMGYKSQQAGGLTDVHFKENSRQSFRERNWFNAPFNVASITLKYDISNSTNIQVKSFYSFAERNSVGFLGAINTKDTINANTLKYNNRQVDRDDYKNFGTEVRSTFKYIINGKQNILATGIRLYNGNTNRNQLGIGTSGTNFDLTLINPIYGRSLEFTTNNYALFAENIFMVSKRWKIVPGIRYEYIKNTVKGFINNTPSGLLSNTNKVHKVILYGLGSEFKVSKTTNLYGNYSLAYRPVTFSELTPSATTETIDPNLKDATGYNSDLGYRGTVKNFLTFDVGVFYLNYNNRIGLITQNGAPFKTNIGTSVSKGIESYIEINPVNISANNAHSHSFSFFASNSFINAKYTRWDNPNIINDPLKSIKKKRVENAPRYIHRFGTTYFYKSFSATIQLNYIGDVYTDAINTELPNLTSTTGKLASYKLIDASFTYKFMQHYNLKAGINNITDENYATRRATGYPGPGLIPGNGRTYFFSLGATF